MCETEERKALRSASTSCNGVRFSKNGVRFRISLGFWLFGGRCSVSVGLNDDKILFVGPESVVDSEAVEGSEGCGDEVDREDVDRRKNMLLRALSLAGC